jgi:aryl-alcohol dehydrogenase-like predicted oxidoreductase
VIDSGRFDTAQVYYNLLNPSAGRALPEAWTGHDFTGVIAAARGQDMGLLAIRILASGVLATDLRHGRESVVTEASDLPTEERRAAAVFASLGADHGTRAQTAIRFVLANPDLSGAIVGLAELAHLEEALGAAEAGPLPQEALDKLDAVYESGFGEG